MSKAETDPIDWSLTTWDGSLREQLRRWSELPLERIILAQEEMQELAERLGGRRSEEIVTPLSTDGT